MNLRQVGRTVTEYEIEFSRLSRFVPQFTTEDKDRAERFLDGLHLGLMKLVATSNPTTYAETLACALRIEAIENLEKKHADRKRERE